MLSVETEWTKQKKLAIKEFKHGLSSYCDIGLYNLKIQITMLERLQVPYNNIKFD